MLGGPSGQVFLGATFPADDEYRLEVQAAGLQIAAALATKGVIGRFATDFVSVKEDGVWKHSAIEVNLRKGGTTHPFLTLRFLTDGSYDPETGLFYSQSGRPKYYYASDSVQSDQYKGIGPSDLVDIAVEHELPQSIRLTASLISALVPGMMVLFIALFLFRILGGPIGT